MQIKHYLLVVLLFSIFLTPAFAQQPASGQVCGYTGKSAWLEWYQQHRDELALERGVDTNWLYVPMTLHMVGTDQGTGHYRLEQGLRNICEMNEYFAEAHIRFYLLPGDPVRYHNSSYWFDHDWDGGSDMINQNYVYDRLNAFVVKNPAGNCGYSWQDAIVLGTDYGCSDAGNTTWSHEAGHHFSLPHTFVGWEGTEWDYSEPAPEEIDGHPVEKVDGSNCLTGGDGFCDTRPDYLNFRWPCDANKESVAAQLDPDSVEFHSDATLIMGYPFDECSSRFSPQQIEAMRTNLYTEHSAYLQFTAPMEYIPDSSVVQLISPIDTQNVQFDNFTLSWNPVPGASFYHVEVGLAPILSAKYYNQILYNTTSVTITTNVPNNRLLKWRVRPYGVWDVCHSNTVIQYGVFRTKNLTATNELEESVVAELSPNPVSSGLPSVFTLTSDEYMDALLSVSDAAGRLCLTQDIRLSPGENRLDIATSGLSAGFYVVTLRNDKGAIVKRLAIID